MKNVNQSNGYYPTMLLEKYITKTEWKFALLFSGALTVFNMINSSQHLRAINKVHMLLTWAVIFVFLLMAWIVNSVVQVKYGSYLEEKISLRKIFFIFFYNTLLLVFLLVALDVVFLNQIEMIGFKENYTLVGIAFQGIVGICLINIILYAVRSKVENQEVQLQNQMLKTENIRAQYEILKQQISPHFLFNSLSTLHSMIRLNNPNSERYVIKLSEMYRQLLVKRNVDYMSLKEELAFVNDYIFMLNARFGEMLNIEIQIPEKMLSAMLPTFSIQLLLENCMKHNIIAKDKPLYIKIYSSQPAAITVENNRQSKISTVGKSGYGLENLNQRYELLGYSEGVIVSADEETFKVTIKLLDI